MENRVSRASSVPKSLCYCCCYYARRPDSILTTQRFLESENSIVGIDKVNLRLCDLSLAHVSHFFFPEKGPWAKSGWTHFAVFRHFVNSQSPALPVSLGPASPFQHLFDAFSASFGTWMPLRAATRKHFGYLDAVSAPFRHLDAISGSYREALWPPGCGFGAISAP